MSLDYENDIRIDQDSLDLEWLDQPHLVLVYSKNLAFWKKQVEIAKQEMDLIKAELDKKIREDPFEYEISVKVTESVVLNTIISQPDYKKAYAKYIDAKYEHNIAQAAVDAVEHRKSALENLVRLYGQQYFAGPKVPNDINRDWEKKNKERKSNEAVARGLKRTKK